MFAIKIYNVNYHYPKFVFGGISSASYNSCFVWHEDYKLWGLKDDLRVCKYKYE